MQSRASSTESAAQSSALERNTNAQEHEFQLGGSVAESLRGGILHLVGARFRGSAGMYGPMESSRPSPSIRAAADTDRARASVASLARALHQLSIAPAAVSFHRG